MKNQLFDKDRKTHVSVGSHYRYLITRVDNIETTMEDPTAAGSKSASEANNPTTASNVGMNESNTSETVPIAPLKASGPAGGNGKSESTNPKLSLPPTVITVDTSKADEKPSQHHHSSSSRRHHEGPSAGEAEGRTPKHANKAPTSEERIEPEKGESADYQRQGAFFPPRPFEGRMGGGPTGAFQPHTRSSQQNLPGPMQVSPQSGRYYANYPAGPFQQGLYDRNMHEYQHRHPYGQQHPYPGIFPPPYQQQGAFNQTQQHQWGPPPQYHGRPPPYPQQHGMAVSQYPPQAHPGSSQPPPPPPSQHHQQRHPANNPITNGDSTFSRAVSSSFDRSVKSRNSDENKASGTQRMEQEHPSQYASSMMNADGGSISDDGSWKQLNQIQSVDEEEIRKRIADKGDVTEDRKHANVKHASSNSSSLTNSPTDGVEKKANLPDPPKMTSSLDSLASVSSAQAPLKTPQEDKLMRPADASLDLMKCSSGSSALLMPPTHSGHAAGSSLQGSHTENAAMGKRGSSEGMRDSAEAGHKEDAANRPAKKTRTGAVEEKKSPLSIACSPSVDPHEDSKEKSPSDNQMYASKDSFYDKPLTYSYSLESVNARSDFPPMAMTRPQSAASSTGTPMQIVPPGGDRNAPSRLGVTQLPSWEITGQDSFGGQSSGNPPLAPSFSFTQEYPGSGHPTGSEQAPPPPSHVMRYGDRPIESRNQSFDNGHFHGSFGPGDTMSFDSRGQASAPEQRQGYQGHFPPHAPSWGSAGSYPHPSGYPVQGPPQYRMTMQPMIMRSFSQESDQHRMNAFQPPSEFQAPPTNINRNRPRKETHIMTTPFEPSKTGVFGWTKEEDMRLTEIMKKFKNPRDWEPIAKELDRNRR